MGLEIINERKKELGLTIEELSEKSGIPAGTLNKILSGATKDPKLGTVKSLAKILGLTLNDFDDEAIINKHLLNKKETELIKQYRVLDSYGTKAVETLMRIEYERCKATTIPDNVRPINLYLTSASAGLGQVMFDDIGSEPIYIPDTEELRKVSYAVKVNGDSMEPALYEGDILLIEPGTDINIGEIGIFNVDGQSYVKEYGNGELISLNPNYDPIPLNEDSRCMGRVVDKL